MSEIDDLKRELRRLQSQLTRGTKPHMVQGRLFNLFERRPIDFKARDLKDGEIVLVEDKTTDRRYLASRIKGKFTFLEFNNADALVRNGGTVVPIEGGGTGGDDATESFDNLSPMTTLGDLIYGGASGTGTRLAGNTTTTQKVLAQTGDGADSAAPEWKALKHLLDNTEYHSSTITENNLMDADANGNPDDSGIAVVDASDAVSKKHTQLCEAADFTKLDGIEASADVTDSVNVQSALETLFGGLDIVCHQNQVVCHNNEVVYV